MYAIRLPEDADATRFRAAARDALAANIPPADITIGTEAGLFGPPPPAPADFHLTAPARFVRLMQSAAMHSAPDRFALLYDVLWRLKHGQPELLSRASDPAVARLNLYARAVGRDIHKMHAFVRFRETPGDADGPIYAAWFEPQHFILRAAAPFFAKRFAQMRWVIMTPRGSAEHLDGRLAFGPPCARPDLPEDSALDEAWNAYFRAIFNPARVKTQAMLREMPKHYWKNMPETAQIPAMLREAEARVAAMDRAPDIAPRFAEAAARQRAARAPSHAPAPAPATLDALRAEAASCARCPLHECATRIVFGEGPPDARIMLVGEQPGDQEDVQGRPFVGPAGQVLDRALTSAGLDRAALYITNAVKHFKFEPRRRRRLHKTPDRGEVDACRFWLDREIDILRPSLIVALGGAAALSLTGRRVAIQSERGRQTELAGRPGLITIHPSFILRLPDPAERRAETARFTDDLKLAASLAEAARA